MRERDHFSCESCLLSGPLDRVEMLYYLCFSPSTAIETPSAIERVRLGRSPWISRRISHPEQHSESPQPCFGGRRHFAWGAQPLAIVVLVVSKTPLKQARNKNAIAGSRFSTASLDSRSELSTAGGLTKVVWRS